MLAKTEHTKKGKDKEEGHVRPSHGAAKLKKRPEIWQGQCGKEVSDEELQKKTSSP